MEKIVSRFKGKLGKMIKNAGSKYDDYSISRESYKKLSHKKTRLKSIKEKNIKNWFNIEKKR